MCELFVLFFKKNACNNTQLLKIYMELGFKIYSLLYPERKLHDNDSTLHQVN